MSIFDDLGKKISKAGGNAVEKTKQRTEISRINGRIKEENKKIDESYRKIGEMFVENFREEAPEEFLVFIRQIDESHDNIEKYLEDINKVKGVKKCPSCGTILPDDAHFCSKCGIDFKEAESRRLSEEEEGSNQIMACPECGAIIKEDVDVCPACGVKIER